MVGCGVPAVEPDRALEGDCTTPMRVAVGAGDEASAPEGVWACAIAGHALPLDAK
jgi:hypothetical protein